MVMDLLVPKPRIIVPKPKSYIKLDMAFGVGAGTSLFDKSRYRSHGTISGAQWAAGLHGYALDFIPGTPSYVEIPAAYTQLAFTSEDFSIITRVYWDSLTLHCMLFMKGLLNTEGYDWLVTSTGIIYFDTTDVESMKRTYSGAGAVVTGTWYTLGISRDGTSVILYVNGLAIPVTSGVHANPQTSARTAKIGIYNDLGTYPMDGRMEFLRVFGGIALPASTHLAYHNALK